MNKYHQLIQEITDLANTPKKIDKEGERFLSYEIGRFMIQHKKTYADDEVIGYMIQKIFDESYLKALNDVLDILRRKQ